MSEYLIDKGIDPKVYSEIEKLSTEISKLSGLADKIWGGTADTDSGVVGKKKKDLTDIEILTRRLEKAEKELGLAQNSTTKAIIEAQQARRNQIQGYKDEINAVQILAKEKAKADAAAAKAAANTPQARIDKTAVNENLRLNAILASQYTTQLEKLDAEMRLLERDMQSKFNPALQQQSVEFRNLNAQHANVQKQYDRTARATGMMGRSMNSAYGQTFQLTQVMREMPNFAIDARIGFMALSNNLPMLADSFKVVKQQIIDTEGAAGAGMKTFKVFAKSLLSLNSIMIIASTLLILFGDDIIDFIGNAFDGRDALDAFRNSFEDYYDAMEDAEGSTGKFRTEIDETLAVLKAATVGVEEFNTEGKLIKKTWEESSRAIGDYEKIRKLLPEKSIKLIEKDGVPDLKIAAEEIKKYYDELIQAQANYQAAQEKNIEITKKKTDLREEMRKAAQRVTGKDVVSEEEIDNVLKKADELKNKFSDLQFIGGSWLTGRKGEVGKYTTGRGGELLFDAEKLSDEEKYIAGFIAQNQKDIAELKSLQTEYESLIYKSEKAKPRQDDKKGRGGRTYTPKDIYAEEEYYNAKRAQLVRMLTILEEQYAETTLDGTLNSFEKRYEAAKRYYDTNAEIILIDAALSEKQANEKYEKAKRTIDKENAYNIKHFKSGSAERIKSDNDYAEASRVLSQNLSFDLQRINDEKNQSLLEQQQKFIQENNDIEQDKFKQELEAMKISEDELLKEQARFERRRQDIIKRKSTKDIFLSAYTGYEKNTDFSEIKEKYDSQKVDLQTNKETIEKKKELAIEMQRETEKRDIEGIYTVEKATLESNQRIYEDKLQKEIDFNQSLADAETDPVKKAALQGRVSSLSSDLAESKAKHKLDLEDLFSKKEIAKEIVDTKAIQTKETFELDKELAQNQLDLENLTKEELYEINKKYEEKIDELKTKSAENTAKAIEAVWEGLFQRYFDKLDEERDRFSEIEENKLQDVEDKAEAGVTINEEAAKKGLSVEKQAEEEKEAIKVYYEGVQKELDRKEADAKKKKFLAEQAVALGNVWINFAMATASAENLLLGGALTPLYLGLALTSSALIAAQTIPYFKEGGDVKEDGIIGVGDGGRSEVMITPDKKIYLTPNKTTYTYAEKGTKILPDVNKVDLNGLMAIMNVDKSFDMSNVENELKGLRKDLRKSKPTNINSLPLLEQIDFASRFNSRSRGL